MKQLLSDSSVLCRACFMLCSLIIAPMVKLPQGPTSVLRHASCRRPADLHGHPQAAVSHNVLVLCMVSPPDAAPMLFQGMSSAVACCMAHAILVRPCLHPLKGASAAAPSSLPLALTCLPTGRPVPGHADLAAQAGAPESSRSHLVRQLLRCLRQAALPGALRLSHALPLQCAGELLHLQVP